MCPKDLSLDNMKFPYLPFPTLKGNLYRPAIPIAFQHKQKFIYLNAIVDSGADFTILPIEIAGVLDLKLDPKQKETFFGAGNNTFSVYPSPQPIEHILRQNGFRTIKWRAKIYFSEAQPTILLGNKGFLEKFKVVLNGPEKEIDIH